MTPAFYLQFFLKGKTGKFNIVLVFSLLNNVYFRFLAVCAVWVHKWPLKIGLFCLFSFFCTTYFLKKSSKNYAICITLEIFLSKRVKRPLKDHFGTYFRSQEVPFTISRKHADVVAFWQLILNRLIKAGSCFDLIN